MKTLLTAGITALLVSLTSFTSVDDSSFFEIAPSSRIETFTFLVNGVNQTGKIYLPAGYKTNDNLPAIFLIDYTEQHFKLATDEFEQVINGVQQLAGGEALVVSLANIPDIDADPSTFQEHYKTYRSLAAYVNGRYTSNTTRTFIGKGSEGGVVLMALFMEDPQTAMFTNFIVTDPSPKYSSAIIDLIEKNSFPQNKTSKKLHFSFSTSNNRALCLNLIDHIKTADYPWLKFAAVEYTDSDYEHTYPVAFPAGIKFVFGK